MAAGLQGDIARLNTQAGQAVVNVATSLKACVDFGVMLNDTGRFNGQTGLVAAGMSSADATVLLASFTDLTALYKVAHAQQQQIGNNDFFFNAKLLMGTIPLV
jgi:hypothetical protein